MPMTIVSYLERRKHIRKATMTAVEERLLYVGKSGRAASMVNRGMRIRLRAAREALGLKSGEVARRLGIPEPSYSRYETGVTPIPIKILADLDTFFRITPSYIVSGSVIDLPQFLREALDAKMREPNRREPM